MVNFKDIEPEYFVVNDFKGSRNGSVLFNIPYCEENSVPYIVFNNIESIFRKSGIDSCLSFCESEKNKRMLDNYVSIIDEIKKEIFSFMDELEEDYFVMGSDFMRFRFRTDDNLVYNKKINIPVSVISLSGIVKKCDIYYPQFKLQECFYETL